MAAGGARRAVLHALLACLVGWLASACASWTAVRRDSTWTLYVKDGESVDVDRFGAALAPAFEAVEARMGPFARRVRVHAWDSQTGSSGESRPPFEARNGSDLHEVPGIGPARVRAFHVKGGPLFFQTSGVFLGVADVGTAVHELVHARIAETQHDLPLWFEEGVASYWGDGAYFGGRWLVDGLACWPLRELREQRIDDAELRRLLSLHARDDYDSRENLLVHFLGWALVFDLAREAPDADWMQWRRTFDAESARDGLVTAARRRLDRALSVETQDAWLERLRADDPGVRFAAAKGLWKLRDVRAIDAMLDALDAETDPEVRVALAINVLLASGETRVGRQRWNRLAPTVFPTLRGATLPDERENQALRDVYSGMRRWDPRRERSTKEALDDLARYWEE